MNLYIHSIQLTTTVDLDTPVRQWPHELQEKALHLLSTDAKLLRMRRNKAPVLEMKKQLIWALQMTDIDINEMW